MKPTGNTCRCVRCGASHIRGSGKMTPAEIRVILHDLLVQDERGGVSSDILHKHINIAINELRNYELVVNEYLMPLKDSSKIDRDSGV